MELKLRFTMDAPVNSAYERLETDRHRRTMTKENKTTL